MAGKASFIPPVIEDNPDGWGPCAIPTALKDIPYQPFSKGDRLGKISDWTGGTYQDRRYMNKYQSQFGAGNQMFSYYHEEDESSFQLVDTSRPQRPLYQRNRNRFGQRNMRRDQRNQRYPAGGMQSLSKNQNRQKFSRKMQRNYGRGQWHDRKPANIHKRAPSVAVREEWKVLEDGEMDFPRLSKLNLPNVEEPEDLYECGKLEFYEKSYDRVTTKNEVPLAGVNRIFHKVTTTDDPIIRKLLSKGNVFATDAIIATLMTATRSVYSWDVVVQRVGSKLFFDKRDDSEFDLLTVSETAHDVAFDEGNGINSPTNLGLEATFINQNFSQQCLKKGQDKKVFPNSNPFVTDEDEAQVASVAYRVKVNVDQSQMVDFAFEGHNLLITGQAGVGKSEVVKAFIGKAKRAGKTIVIHQRNHSAVIYARYRKWNLGDGIELIVRCEHDAVMLGPNGEEAYINIKTLNEWDPRAIGVDWRQKLDSQRGAVLATALRNNSCKLAKWTASSILAGSEYLKLGYVSRVNFMDSSKHSILGTQQFRPKEFATQIALNMDNAWGILRCIIDTCMKLNDGKYLILKDPLKGVVRIYDIPDNTFESSDEEEEEEEEEEDEGKDGEEKD